MYWCNDFVQGHRSGTWLSTLLTTFDRFFHEQVLWLVIEWSQAHLQYVVQATGEEDYMINNTSIFKSRCIYIIQVLHAGHLICVNSESFRVSAITWDQKWDETWPNGMTCSGTYVEQRLGSIKTVECGQVGDTIIKCLMYCNSCQFVGWEACL